MVGSFDLDSPSLTSNNREAKKRAVTTNHREVCWELLSRENAAQMIRFLLLLAFRETHPDITKFMLDLQWWQTFAGGTYFSQNGTGFSYSYVSANLTSTGVIGIKGYILDENAVQTTIDDIFTLRLVTCHRSKIFSWKKCSLSSWLSASV